MPKHVLIACNVSKELESALVHKGYDLVSWNSDFEAHSIQGILTSTKLRLNQEKLKEFPNLKWVGRLGSGMEIIDQEYCKEQNIRCVSSPGGIANSVAEHICGMLISWHKNIQKTGFEIKQNNWSREPNRGHELASKTLGIIGCGHTGKATAQLMQNLCKEVIAFDKYKTNSGIDGVDLLSLEELKSKADIISFHVPLNKETTHYYNKEFSTNCKTHLLVNTSRGAVVSNKAMLHSLQEGLMEGACLDVIEGEEKLHDSTHEQWKIVRELSEFNVIITPHIAGYSFEAVEKMSSELLKQLHDIL